MKKVKLFLAAALLCGGTYAGYSAYEQATMTPAELLFKQNLEALTNGGEDEEGKSAYKIEGTMTVVDENGEEVKIPYVECGGKGTIVCP